jgi:thiol-disulfide isomerase/thioredoxin
MKRTAAFSIIFLMISFLTVNGQNIRLISASDLESRLTNGKDTTFVVNFWATWCVPCLRELPNFEKLQAEFAGQKLKVILLSIDNKSKANSAVATFVRKRKLKNEVLVADEQKPQDYISKLEKSWTGSLPATLIVNKARNKRLFFEKEFSYPDLLNEYKLLN